MQMRLGSRTLVSLAQQIRKIEVAFSAGHPTWWTKAIWKEAWNSETTAGSQPELLVHSQESMEK